MHRMLVFPGHKKFLRAFDSNGLLTLSLCDESPTPDIDTIKLINVCHANPEVPDKTIKEKYLYG